MKESNSRIKKMQNKIFIKFKFCHYLRKKLKKSEIGCCLSHLWCLDKIIEKKMKNAIIFEDDIIFHKNFENMFYNLFSKKKYDFLLLGACDFNFSKKNFKHLNKGIYKPDKTSTKVYGAHANYY